MRSSQKFLPPGTRAAYPGAMHPLPPQQLLRRLLPLPHVQDVFTVEASYAAPEAYAALLAYSPQQSFLLHALFALHDLPGSIPGLGASLHRAGPYCLSRLGPLGEFALQRSAPHELALGFVGAVWQPGARLAMPNAAAFVPYAQPGTAKVLWHFAVQPLRERHCQVQATLAVQLFGATAHARFAAYWRLMRHPSRLCRRYLVHSALRPAAAGA
jgi:hypothetical protein